jgi:L-malate glycosyltransferase
VEIHQVAVGASYGDAISNEVLTLQRRLREDGPSEYYACRIDPRIDAHPLESYEQRASAARGDNVLIFHSSVFDARMHRFLMRRPERIVLRYHNLTPPELVAPWDRELASLLRQGREELVELASRTSLAICDSAYNAADARSLGFDRVVAVPIMRDWGYLAGLRKRLPAFLPRPRTGPVVVFVGRFSPSKGHAKLMAAFHVLKTYLHDDAHMVLVGGTDIPAYAKALREYADGLGLRSVIFAGHVSDEALAGVYRRADVFLSMSAHEGFGVPLVESMSFGVPVVAWATTAVPETLGAAGVLLDAGNPLLAAEAVRRVLDDGGLREELRAAGKRRVAELDPAVTVPAFMNALRSAA